MIFSSAEIESFQDNHLSCLWKLLKIQVWEVAENDLLLEVVPDGLELVAVGSTKGDLVPDQAALPQVEVDKGDNPKGLVTLGTLSPGPSGDIFARAKDDRVHS